MRCYLHPHSPSALPKRIRFTLWEKRLGEQPTEHVPEDLRVCDFDLCKWNTLQHRQPAMVIQCILFSIRFPHFECSKLSLCLEVETEMAPARWLTAIDRRWSDGIASPRRASGMQSKSTEKVRCKIFELIRLHCKFTKIYKQNNFDFRIVVCVCFSIENLVHHEYDRMKYLKNVFRCW